MIFIEAFLIRKNMGNVEIWKDVVGYEGYYKISNMGVVNSLRREVTHKLKGHYVTKERFLTNNIINGYFAVRLYQNTKQKHYYIHRLVSLAFIENKDNKPFINHINGIKTDNRVENLEWCTQKENVQHAFNTGLAISAKGECYKSKLTEKQVLKIRKSSLSQVEIAKFYGVNQGLISKILNRVIWTHI